MITIDEALRLKEQLLALLDEEPANQERILDRLDSILLSVVAALGLYYFFTPLVGS